MDEKCRARKSASRRLAISLPLNACQQLDSYCSHPSIVACFVASQQPDLCSHPDIANLAAKKLPYKLLLRPIAIIPCSSFEVRTTQSSPEKVQRIDSK
jgi:hypothetical protein